jgi:hypothetical protein
MSRTLKIVSFVLYFCSGLAVFVAIYMHYIGAMTAEAAASWLLAVITALSAFAFEILGKYFASAIK